MKNIYVLVVLFSLISCERIQYDGEKRLVFQTVVKNSNGEPLPNSTVEIETSNLNSSDLISTGRTNQNGEVTLIFPAARYSDVNISLKIYNEDPSYLTKELFNLRKKDFEDYKFILPNANLLKLDETAPLRLIHNQTNFGILVSKISVNGIYHIGYEVYNYYPDYYFPLTEEILLKKNQTFQLKYSILNTQTNVETDHIVDLTIGTEPLTYTINY